MLPCRIVSDAASCDRGATSIPLRIFDPETNETEAASLLFDLAATSTTHPRPTHHIGIDGVATKRPINPLRYEKRANFTPRTPATTYDRRDDIDELASSHTVGVYFTDNGDVQLLEDERSHTTPLIESDPAMNTALWNAYMAGFCNGVSAAASKDVQNGYPVRWTTGIPNIQQSHRLPQQKRKETTSIPPPARLYRPKRPRRSRVENRTCRNCGTKTTPFWRKDRVSGEPLCNACGLYFTKNDGHRPASLWQQQQQSTQSTSTKSCH